MSPELPLRVRADIEDLDAYESPQRPARFQMNTNESPYPPPEDLIEEAVTAVRAADLNRYPDHGARDLLEGLAELASWPVDGVAVGNGSNEVLLHLFLAYGGPGRRALVFEPTYVLHHKLARITGTQVVRAERGPGFAVDPVAAARVVKESAPEIVMLCSPNNPTGNCEDRRVVEQLLEIAPGLVIVDEAYVEFAGPSHELQSLLEGCPNLVIVKTMSKAWRLAGVRLGYMLAAPVIVGQTERVRLPYHLSVFSQAIGAAAIRRAPDALEHVRAITDERERIERGLTELGVDSFESHANFLLFRVPSARKVWSVLLDEGVLVRDYSTTEHLEECLRVTAGTRAESDAFLDAMKKALTRG